MRNDKIRLKKFIILLDSFILSFILLGCSNESKTSPPKDITYVPVGTFSELPFDLYNCDWLFTSQSSFYYSETLWNREQEHWETRLCRWDDGSNTPQVIIAPSEEKNNMLCAFPDGQGNVYYFGYKTGENILQYNLKKYDEDSICVIDVSVPVDSLSILEGINIKGGAADGNGRICLYDHYGNLYLFRENGEFYKQYDTQIETSYGMLSTDEGEVFLYYFDSKGTMETLFLSSVNMENGELSRAVSFPIDSGTAVKNLWAGTGENMLLADAEYLWEVNPVNGVREKLLTWEDVNIYSSQIYAVSIGENGSIVCWLYDEFREISEYVLITMQDKDSLSEKQTITLGTTKDLLADQLSYFTKRFNRQSAKWHIELVEYFSYYNKHDNYLDSLTIDIIKGNAPDILDTRMIPVEFMENKELFVNLQPYFEESTVVSQRDILESVWREGCLQGNLTFVMPWFSLESYAIRKETLNGQPWNLKTMISISDSYPDSEMLNYMGRLKRRTLLEFALEANAGLFYNMETEECFFDDEEFKELLRGIKRVEEKDTETVSADPFDLLEDFQNGNLLVYQSSLSNMSTYMRMNRIFGDTVSWSGYPSEFTPYNRFQGFVNLGINNSSQNKEGAWAFLEYLLSAEVQGWNDQMLGYCPVRTDAYENYIRTSKLVNEDFSVEYATDEECQALRNMVENAYVKPYRIFDPVYDIILDECDAYFNDSKDIDQVAAIIQNRVSLYLAE